MPGYKIRACRKTCLKIMNIYHIDNHIWTPVRTKPKREKKVAEFCKAHNITTYLPLNRKLHRYDRRTVEFFVPMFPGYIFCNLNEEVYKTLLQSNSIVFRINLDVEAEKQLIEELIYVQAFEQISTEKEVIVNPELVEGVKIKVSGGPLKGTHGFVEKRRGKTIVSINIEMLNQSVSVEVDAGDLEIED